MDDLFGVQEVQAPCYVQRYPSAHAGGSSTSDRIPEPQHRSEPYWRLLEPYSPKGVSLM